MGGMRSNHCATLPIAAGITCIILVDVNRLVFGTEIAQLLLEDSTVFYYCSLFSAHKKRNIPLQIAAARFYGQLI